LASREFLPVLHSKKTQLFFPKFGKAALIYNDVYATYFYKSNKIFCIEIHNQELAAMQKQLFDFIWEEAEIMEFIDERGGARVRG